MTGLQVQLRRFISRPGRQIQKGIKLRNSPQAEVRQWANGSSRRNPKYINEGQNITTWNKQLSKDKQINNEQYFTQNTREFKYTNSSKGKLKTDASNGDTREGDNQWQDMGGEKTWFETKHTRKHKETWQFIKVRRSTAGCSCAPSVSLVAHGRGNTWHFKGSHRKCFIINSEVPL